MVDAPSLLMADRHEPIAIPTVPAARSSSGHLDDEDSRFGDHLHVSGIGTEHATVATVRLQVDLVETAVGPADGEAVAACQVLEVQRAEQPATDRYRGREIVAGSRCVAARTRPRIDGAADI